MKKILILTICALIAFIITACGNDTNPEQSTTSQNSSITSVEQSGQGSQTVEDSVSSSDEQGESSSAQSSLSEDTSSSKNSPYIEDDEGGLWTPPLM